MMDNSNGQPTMPPPPAYGSAEAYMSAPPPNAPPPEQAAYQTGPPAASEPPPKYETPKEGPYANQPTGYAPQQQGGYPGNPYPAGYNQYAQTQPILTTQPGAYGAVPVSSTTVIIHDAGWGPQPRIMECPNCHVTMTTVTSYHAGALTWLLVGLICLFGFWIFCCLIPFCIPDCQDVEHKCPNCGRHLATYRRI